MNRALLSVLLCAGPLAAQSTWVVDVAGGGDFMSLQAAVNAASDGDTILVDYWSGLAVPWSLTLTKGLTIVGVGFDRAEVWGHLVIDGLAAPQRVVLRTLQGDTITGLPLSITVQHCAGTVVLDDLVLDSDHGPFSGATDVTVTVLDSAHVAIARSQLHGNVGLRVEASAVTCTGTTIRGRTIDVGPGSAAAAVTATNGRVWFADCTLAGGSNLNLGGFSGPGRSGLVLVDANATLADVDVLGGYGLGGFAASVSLDPTSALTRDAATFLRDGTSGAGTQTDAETGILTGGLGRGRSTFTLDAAPGAFGLLVLSLPGPQVATPFGPYWLSWLAAPIALGDVPVARTLPPPWFLRHGFVFALQGAVLHGGELRLSVPLLTTSP
jgi:hypothetical protein